MIDKTIITYTKESQTCTTADSTGIYSTGIYSADISSLDIHVA